jgi:hypothetical protein
MRDKIREVLAIRIKSGNTAHSSLHENYSFVLYTQKLPHIKDEGNYSVEWGGT